VLFGSNLSVKGNLFLKHIIATLTCIGASSILWGTNDTSISTILAFVDVCTFSDGVSWIGDWLGEALGLVASVISSTHMYVISS